MSREKLVNRQLNPLLQGLPDWVASFRPQQIEAIDRIVRAFERGIRVVVLEAPTGAGKTLIAESVRRILRARAIYLCTTKDLQDQFARDFEYAAVIRGRDNYPTERYPGRFNPGEWSSHLSCGDCKWRKSNPVCDLCRGKVTCPYERAKRAAIISDLAVGNTAYALSEWNHVGRLSERDLVVVDEADELEGVIMGHVEAFVSSKRIGRYGWRIPKITVAEDWVNWIDEVMPDVDGRIKELDDGDRTLSKGENAEEKYLRGLGDKLSVIRAGLDANAQKWVFTGREGEVAFKPVYVSPLGESLVWRHGHRFLLMSATVISAEHMVRSLGYEGPYAFVGLGSDFPRENREFVVRPIANMGRKHDRERGIARVGDTIAQLAARHAGDRMLVHCVSYNLTNALASHLERHGLKHVYRYSSSEGKRQAQREWLERRGGILLAPSLDRGADFAGDKCRVQVIAKVPFPNLGDRQIAARKYGGGREGDVWYAVQTVRTIVQMAGRAVRSREDWARTYCLDSAFEGVLWSNGGRGMFPQWFKEAMVWER